jgi:hypothetical protein
MFFENHSESISLVCMISRMEQVHSTTAKSDARRGFQPFCPNFSVLGETVALVDISVPSDTTSSYRPLFSCARPGTACLDQAQFQASSLDTLARIHAFIVHKYGNLGEAATIFLGLCSYRANSPGVLTTAPCADLQNKPRVRLVVCDLDPWRIIIRTS